MSQRRNRYFSLKGCLVLVLFSALTAASIQAQEIQVKSFDITKTDNGSDVNGTRTGSDFPKSRYVTALRGSMTADSQGRLYVADYGNGTVVRIDPDGTASIQVSGIDRPRSPIFDDSMNLYLGSFNGHIYRIAPSGEKYDLASGIWSPQAMGLDRSGNLYVACGYDGNIYRISPDGAISSISSGFKNPKHLVIGPSGDIYVADTNGVLIVRIAPGGGKASLVDIGEPIGGLAIDSSERIYVSHNDQVSRVDPSGAVSEVASGLNQPTSLALSGRDLFVTVAEGTVRVAAESS